MTFPKRDLIATLLVVAGGVLYGLWLADSAPAGLDGVRATGLVVLVLGFAASATAVVPAFDQVLHGNKVYLAVTAALGLIALAAGVQMLVASSELGLGALVAAMGVLWLIATAHHVMLARTPPPAAVAPARREPVGAHGSRHHLV